MAEVENVTGFSTSDYKVRKFHELKQLGSFICHFLALSVFTFLAFNALVFVFLTFDFFKGAYVYSRRYVFNAIIKNIADVIRCIILKPLFQFNFSLVYFRIDRHRKQLGILSS